MEEEWRMEGGEGGRGEYYTKIVGLRESISSTGAVVKELNSSIQKYTLGQLCNIFFSSIFGHQGGSGATCK